MHYVLRNGWSNLNEMNATKSITLKPDDSFEDFFFKDKLQGERIKETLLAIILTIVLIASIIDSIFLSSFEENLSKSFRWFILIISFLIIRAILIRRFQDKRLKFGRRRYIAFSYFNVIFETSIPSILIIVFSHVFNPTLSLISPIVFLYFVFLILPIFELDYKLCVLAGIVAGVEYYILAISFKDSTSFEQDLALLNLPYVYLAKSLLLLLVGIVSGIIAERIKRNIVGSYETIREREEIKRIFGQQLSTEIVDDLLENQLEIVSRTRNICIMFLDIRDYSKYCEGKSPEEIIGYQNNVLGFMIDIVNKHNGIVNQIMGDGFMASFGAPVTHENDSQNAFNASMEILSELKNRIENKVIPKTKIGIGLHEGEVITGNVGAINRKQYSITGSPVILASRIEQLNKEFNSSLIISKKVLDSISCKEIKPEELGLVNVKGFDEPVEVYKIV